MSRLKIVVSAVKAKVRLLFQTKCALSAVVFDSEIKKNVAIRQKCRIYESSIKRYSYVSRNSLIQDTDIGMFCSISENCNIGMPSHPTDFVSTSPVFLKSAIGDNVLSKQFAELAYNDCERTTIGNDVWIGAGVQIKGGIKIGDGAVIGAGAVVTHDVPPYAVVAGVPAKVIRKRFSDEIIDGLLKTQWWTLSEAELKNYSDAFNQPKIFLEKWRMKHGQI